MELKDTIKLMTSEDYKERFKAEYYQLKIRCERLSVFIYKYRSGELDFEPSCSLELLLKQFNAMIMYLNILKVRADIENVKLKIYE